MKKILIVQPIHEKGMELLKSNSDYSYEVVEDLSSVRYRTHWKKKKVN